MANCVKAKLKVAGQRFKDATPQRLLPSYACPQGWFDLSHPVEEFFPILRDAETNAKAFGMLRAMGETGSKGNEKAVYVIGVVDRPVSKIGISYDPVGRLQGLQNSHYEELYLHAVVFCPTRKSGSIEQASLQSALESEKRLRGEWVDMPPEDALKLVLETARDNKWPVCDGATWFENMVIRTRELAINRKIARLPVRQQLRYISF